MASRPDRERYNLSTELVPVNGELARNHHVETFDLKDRILMYNQDVLYHQNLEVLRLLDQ